MDRQDAESFDQGPIVTERKLLCVLVILEIAYIRQVMSI